MFDSPFDFFSLVIALVAFIFARKALNQVAVLRARLDALGASATATTAMPPPLPARQAPFVPPTSDSTRIKTTEEEAPSVQPAPAPQPASEVSAPPPLPQAQPGFEERIGTRWVVWVGGLTLALGGFSAQRAGATTPLSSSFSAMPGEVLACEVGGRSWCEAWGDVTCAPLRQ